MFVLVSERTISVILFTGILGLSSYWLCRKRKVKFEYNGRILCLESPPCVPWIPILGSIPFLPPFPVIFKFFTKKAYKYKNIAAYYVMGKYRIVLNSREAIHEAFVKRSADFSSRPPGSINNLFNPDRKGIVFHPYNEDFKKYHKLSLGIMKQFGFGNRIMEKRIMEEVVALMETVAELKGEEFDPKLTITKCSMNIICGILFGKRFKDDDPELSSIMENIKASFSNLPKVFIASIFPFLRHFSLFKNALANSIKAQENVFAMLEDKIVECTDELNDHHSFIRSYIEAEGESYDKDQLLHFMHEMFLVGTETTASTLEWSMVLLGNHVDVQEKMFAEMQKIGDNLPSLDDKKDLPFCEAVLCEIMRMKPVVPMTLPHITTRDTHVMGYHIPDKTIVFANIHSVHHNVETWGDPEIFRPERFMNGGSLDISIRDLLVPFSLGKRSCFGEILAKQEVFLSLMNLVKRFKILPPVDQKEISVDDVMDVTSKPSHFNVRLVERTSS